MNKSLTGLLIATILLFIAFGGFFLLHLGKLLKVEQPVKQPITKYEITLECQRLVATRTHDGFGYESCLEQLEDAAEEDLVKGVKTI